MKLVVATSALVLACGLPCYAASAAAPSGQAYPVGSRAVSPTSGAADENDAVTLLAAGPDYVAFVRHPHFASYGSRGDTAPTVNAARVYVASRSGKVSSLGLRLPPTFDTYFDGYSIEGGLLTWDYQFGRTVHWINVKTHRRGAARIPNNATYIGSTRSGWAYVASDNTLFLETTAGTVTSLGRPLGKEQAGYVDEGATGPRGVLVTDRLGRAAYVAFAHPNRHVRLKTENYGREVAGTKYSLFLNCEVLTVSAFCADGEGDFSPPFAHGEQLALNGKTAPIAYNKSFAAYAASDHLTAIQPENNSNLDLLNTKLRYVRTVHFELPPLPVGRPSSVLYGTGSIKAVSRAGAVAQTFVAPKDSPIEVDQPALTTGRTIWEDDQAGNPQPGSPHIYTRTIINSGGRLVLGKRQFIANDNGNGNSPVAGGAVTAWVSSYGEPDIRVTFRTPLTSYHFELSDDNGIQTISGTRAIADSGRLFDLRTGKSHIPRYLDDAVSMDLWGNDLVYLLSNGQAWLRNLASGTKQQLADVGTPAQAQGSSIFTWRNEVAWQTGSGEAAPISVLDLGSSSSTPTTISDPPGRLRSLSSDGLLYANHSTYWLQRYGAQSADRLLPHAFVAGGMALAVESSVVTWVGTDGILHAAPLPFSPQQAWLLGNQISPRSLGKSWRAMIPFSAPLRSCTFVFSRHGRVLRRVPCNATDMTQGDAVVTWNGKRSSGPAASKGTVSWALHATSSAGAVRGTDGSATAIDGSITIR